MDKYKVCQGEMREKVYSKTIRVITSKSQKNPLDLSY